jgi:L-fuculose-phosphate aldolase
VNSLKFERTARIQLFALTAGDINPTNPVLGREAHDWILRPRRSQIGFEYYARKALSRHPDVLR